MSQQAQSELDKMDGHFSSNQEHLHPVTKIPIFSEVTVMRSSSKSYKLLIHQNVPPFRLHTALPCPTDDDSELKDYEIEGLCPRAFGLLLEWIVHGNLTLFGHLDMSNVDFDDKKQKDECLVILEAELEALSELNTFAGAFEYETLHEKIIKKVRGYIYSDWKWLNGFMVLLSDEILRELVLSMNKDLNSRRRRR